MAAYSIGSLEWLGFALVLLILVLVVLPGLLYLGLKLTNPTISKLKLKREFVNQSYALVPFGLSAWVAFSLSFVFTNFSYVLAVISDPFGWGWNTFGTAGIAWTPFLGTATPLLQVLSLLAGLALTVLSSRKIARESAAPTSSLPLIGLSTFMMIGLLWILVG